MQRAAVLLCLIWAGNGMAWAQAPTPPEKQATIAWLTRLQDSTGGFAADQKEGARPSLPTTVSAVRALKYFGSSPPRGAQIIRYLHSCWNEKEGGFAPTQGGKVDVRTTAVALMGLYDLEASEQNQDMINRGLAYLGSHVKDYEDIRIAAAAVEATKRPAPETRKWRDVLDTMPASSDPKQARETGGVVVARMRLGESIQNQEAILRTLLAAQQPGGAWGKPQAAPDLESTYRVMRAFYMLKARPDVAAIRKFIASCRQPDGGYAVAPGQPATVSGAYYAGIISYWLDWLSEHGKAP